MIVVFIVSVVIPSASGSTSGTLSWTRIQILTNFVRQGKQDLELKQICEIYRYASRSQ
jgi:hypothetical protein